MSSGGNRLDRRLRALRPDLSWTAIRQAITRGQVTIDGAVECDPATPVALTSTVDLDRSRPVRRTARLSLPRLYEDDEILVVDKPAGLLTIATAAGRGDREDTVLARLQDYARRLRGRQAYAGMLHRLDRGTSGALAAALSRDAHRAGRALFGAHAFDRWYLAVVNGVPASDGGTIAARISNAYVSGRRRIVRRAAEGREAITYYRVRERFTRAALLELRLETGRQHQIRLHLQQLGHPIAGDEVYAEDGGRSGAPNVARPLLHAWRLRFPHPLRDGIVIDVEAPLPADFEAALTSLRRR